MVSTATTFSAAPPPRRTDDLMRIGLFWPVSRGVLAAPFLMSQNPPALDLSAHQRLAREVEAAGFDFALLADGYGTISPESTRIGHHNPSTHALLWAVALFAVTNRMGFISTMHTTFIETIDLAQFGSQLDHISGGRWGWNVTTGYREHESKLFGLDGLGDHDERYGIAEEAVATVRQLWAPGKPEVRLEEGAHRRVVGALPGPSPTNSLGPAIVNAGASDQGLKLAARYCDYLFAPVVEHTDVADLQQRLADEGSAFGRSESAMVLTGVRCMLRDTEQEAEDEWQVVETALAASAGSKAFKSALAKGSRSSAEFMRRGGGTRPSTDLVGTPRTVADEIARRYHDHGYRGFLMMPPYWGAGEFTPFAELFERLERHGVWAPASKRGSLW
jgi:FMNH2-dependent dimethyl sulfone monooxygenase